MLVVPVTDFIGSAPLLGRCLQLPLPDLILRRNSRPPHLLQRPWRLLEGRFFPGEMVYFREVDGSVRAAAKARNGVCNDGFTTSRGTGADSTHGRYCEFPANRFAEAAHLVKDS